MVGSAIPQTGGRAGHCGFAGLRGHLLMDLAIQYAALPYRQLADSGLKVLLITSRETKRWVIPKGWPVPNLLPHESAAHEAVEEAGVRGRISAEPIGSYDYDKRLAGSVITCRVIVFGLQVDEELSSWREQDQRERRWFPHRTAAELVQEPQLKQMIHDLNDRSWQTSANPRR